MNPQGTDLLSQLRDIHSAPPAPWWPPAPGWWVLSIVVLVLVVFVVSRALAAWRRRREHQRLYRWLEALEDRHDPGHMPQAFLAGVNRLMKWVALRAFPSEPIAALQGEAWTTFLRQRIGQAEEVAHLDALSAGPYQPVPEFDAAAMVRLARLWIRRHG